MKLTLMLCADIDALIEMYNKLIEKVHRTVYCAGLDDDRFYTLARGQWKFLQY